MARRPNIKEIVQAACDVYGVTPEYVNQPNRKREVIWIRQSIHYWARKLTRLPLREIGRIVGKRDHATVIWSVKVVSGEYKLYEDRKIFIDDIELKLQERGFRTEKYKEYEQ